MLSDEQLHDLATDYFADQWAIDKAILLMQEVEAEARREALEEAAKAVEKATYSKRWAKAAVNSQPDYVPPCEFAALIRAMKKGAS